MNYAETMEKAHALELEIKNFLQAVQYEEYSDLSGVDYDPEDADQCFAIDEMRLCAEHLDDVRYALQYLRRPVIETSRLHRDAGGRYQTDSGFVYTAGTAIEALITDEYHDRPYWSASRVEYADGRYYIVGYNNVTLDGLLVRRRGHN